MIFSQAKLFFEFTLVLEKITALPVDLLTLVLHEDVEALTVQTRWRHSEVNESDARAKIRRKQSVLVTRQHEEGELTIACDLFVTDLHYKASANFLDFLVEDTVHDGINFLDILDQNGYTVLKTLGDTSEEVWISEARLLDLA